MNLLCWLTFLLWIVRPEAFVPTVPPRSLHRRSTHHHPLSMRSTPNDAEVYILVYEPGTPNQGVHTIQQHEQDTVLAFADRSAAFLFARQLTLRLRLEPHRMRESELQKLCGGLSVEYRIVPEGVELIPPDQNVLQLGILEALERVWETSSEVEPAIGWPSASWG